MKNYFLVFVIAMILGLSTNSKAQNSVFYAGNGGTETFYDVVQLSDQSYLVSGYADNLDWVDAGIKRISLSIGNVKNGSGTNKIGFILRLSADLKTILSVTSFAKGAVEDIRYIKFTNQPGQPTGSIYISGNTSDTRANSGGYFIAKLNNNYVNGDPTNTSWIYPVWAEGYPKSYHPWDVGNDGRVIYIQGQSHAYDWASAEALDANGNHRVIENWRTHRDLNNNEVYGTAAENGGVANLSYSVIMFKYSGRGDLRSWTTEDYNAITPDGNGGTKQGKWPFDVLFNSPWNKVTKPTSGGGYTGYKPSSTPVYGPSAVVIDRRNNDMYIGMNSKSVLPEGNPDFEPAVIAYDATGTLKWWSRLYHEIRPNGDKMNSSPDQYIDYLAVDYSSAQTNGDLVVLARCHGNNTENLWEGNTINSNPGAKGFQNAFTGSNGNIHISYLAKLKLTDGVLKASTYIAEYVDDMKNAGPPSTDPIMDGWPDPNTGWPELNTTRVKDINVLADGSVVVNASGRRTITTTNAYQKNVKPSEGKGTWNDFIRIYKPDLSGITYSTLLTGVWSLTDGSGGGNTEMFGTTVSGNNLVIVGRQTAASGVAKGNNIPTTNIPLWGSANPSNESAIVANLAFGEAAPNTPPSVNITAPANNATFTQGATISITANASDSDGTISKVEFFEGNNKLGEDASSPYSFDWTNAAAANYSLTAKATDNKGAVTTSAIVNITINPVAGGDGLKADYYHTRDLTGAVIVSRTDATVNFGWGNGSFETGKNTDNFSARWTGQVKPQYSELYTFETETDDGVRLWVNGTLLIDKWVNQSPTKWTGTINLTANQKYDIKMEYFENGGGAVAHLRWSSASQALEIIPQSRLYSTSPPVAVTGVSVNPSTATLTAGGETQLIATVAPANATNKTVNWSSNSTSVATVNSSGLVTAVAEGNATITVTTQDGSFTATSTITVNAPVAGNVVYAINAGGASFTVTDGTVYEADRYFTGGSTYTTGTTAIANTTDDDLYRSERYGNMSYEFPVANGDYSVTLKFAEIYQNGTGKRQFDVAIEGVQSVSNLDIYAAAGGNYTAYDVIRDVTVSDGKLNIAFTADIDNAKISAILVQNSSQLKKANVATDVDVEKGSKFNVYPSPASNFLTIENDNEGETQVTIVSVYGKTMLVSKHLGKFKSVLDISSFPSGIYFINAVSNQGKESKKIVVR